MRNRLLVHTLPMSITKKRRQSSPIGMTKVRTKDSPPQISLRQSDESYFAAQFNFPLQKKLPSAPVPFIGSLAVAEFPTTLYQAHPLSKCISSIVFQFLLSVNTKYFFPYRSFLSKIRL